jgi:DNA-directed RNA polymerase beta subunit
LRAPHSIPDLTEIQTRSYEAFLQYDVAPNKRTDQGIEGVLREIFPIESYDKTLSLDYIKYELGKPRYGPDECRQLRLTYGRPFRVWLRLNKEQPVEEEVYLGDMPIMIGGGEFIINGAERVVVSQLHRSPGVDFVVEIEAGDRKLHACRVIPERGSWIELQVTKKDTLGVRIDQSGKFSSMTLLRAMDPEYSNDEAILRTFHGEEVEKVSTKDKEMRSKLVGSASPGDPPATAVGDVIDVRVIRGRLLGWSRLLTDGLVGVVAPGAIVSGGRLKRFLGKTPAAATTGFDIDNHARQLEAQPADLIPPGLRVVRTAFPGVQRVLVGARDHDAVAQDRRVRYR